MNRFLIAALLSLALCSAAGAQVPAGGLTNIGVAAGVRGAVHGIAPGQAAGRVIGSGKPVYLNDHITTGPDSRLQILLLDETTFTLGPNSDMVLDEFVYDPKTSLGKVSARIAQGTFRFITGKVAQKDPASMKVTLPVGTIGIRGTMVAGHAHDRNAEIVLVGPGRENNAQERRGGITVFNEHGHSNVDSSGYGVTIEDGGRPSRGFRFNAAQLSAILDELEPHHTAGKGGPLDAPRNSGDVLAHGGVNFKEFQTLAVVAQTLDQTATFASQQVASSCSSGSVDCWSDLIAIPSGSVNYQGSGNFSCSGTGCGSFLGGPTGTFFFAINTNFASQTLGGGSSTIQVGSIDDSVNVPTISYSALSGTAKYTFTATDVPTTDSGGNFSGSAIQYLRGAGGQPAASMQMNLNYVNTSQQATATGTTTGAKQNGPYNPG